MSPAMNTRPAAVARARRSRMRRRRRAVASSSTISPRMARRRAVVKVGPRAGPRRPALEATALLRLSFESEVDEPRNQVAVREARMLPELGVHAHRREARYRVDFIQEERPVSRQEEVDPRKPCAVDR